MNSQSMNMFDDDFLVYITVNGQEDIKYFITYQQLVHTAGKIT